MGDKKLHVYAGRESLNKEKFMYKKLKERGGRTVVLVPDQYTLVGERQAMKYLEKTALMDIEIMSISRMGDRLLDYFGRGNHVFITEYGRHILLTGILREEEDRLKVFRGSKDKLTFVNELNDFIAQAKQFKIGPGQLAEIASGLEEHSLVRDKLDDLVIIYDRYERELEGKYSDSEDMVDRYISLCRESDFVREREFWFYGFDSFTPKNLQLIEILAEVSAGVNVVLTWDRDCHDEELFALTGYMISKLEKIAEENGFSFSFSHVPEEYRYEGKACGIADLEKNLYAIGRQNGRSQGIRLVKCANPYNEIESAAAFINSLVIEEGLRYKDIVVINNDQKERGSIIPRVFYEYGIPVFEDSKRPILNSPIAVFVVAIVECVENRFRTNDLLKVLKSGFTSLTYEQIEELENYAVKYKIRGTMWKKDFVLGTFEYTEEDLERLNGYRKEAVGIFEDFEKIYRQKQTYGQFLEKYFNFLENRTDLIRATEDLINSQNEEGYEDKAEETSQIWAMTLAVFEQINELMGEKPFDGREFIEFMIAAFSRMEVGVIPPKSDQVLVGSMQRTRTADVKVLLVVGVNTGYIPMVSADSALFTPDEEAEILGQGEEIGKTDSIRLQEENLAIYRNLSKPTDWLWLSYAVSDVSGNETRASELIDTVKDKIPELVEEEDVISRGAVTEYAGNNMGTLRHFAEALQLARKGVSLDPSWQTIEEEFERLDSESYRRLKEGFRFTNRQDPLPDELAEKLYQKGGVYSVSPTRFEKFSRCPFSHFVAYGLRPEERREYSVASREIGDLYHQVLMELSRQLTEEDRWDEICEAEVRERAKVLLADFARGYRDGLFDMDGKSKYRLKRAEKICQDVCWAMVYQWQHGQIIKGLFENSFGRGMPIDPIVITVKGAGDVYVEGKIDRVDYLQSGRVKIIDYKTGNENFNMEEARQGYRLQLMLYLTAAEENSKKPAGVFYFLIAEPKLKPGESLMKQFRLNGVVLDDMDVIHEIDRDFQTKSDILPISWSEKNKRWNSSSEKHLLSQDDFDSLEKDFRKLISELAEDLVSGDIEIRPKRNRIGGKDETPCTYCPYRSICRFDLNFRGCSYDILTRPASN